MIHVQPIRTRLGILRRALRRQANRALSIGTTGEQWLRVVMNRETRALVQSLQPDRFRALEISGDRWKNVAKFKSYRSVRFPEFDICESRLDSLFDIIIAEQVFEHISRPYAAARNIYEMLDRGGYFLLTTPFLVKVHPHPEDCTRWTESGIKYFLEESGFASEGMIVQSWGNRACLIANLRKWALYRPLLHSLHNDPELPLVVWALARKL